MIILQRLNKLQGYAAMNRKKKINDILKKKQKKANAKLHKSNKPRYISKAERAKMEEEEKAQQAAAEQVAFLLKQAAIAIPRLNKTDSLYRIINTKKQPSWLLF